MTTLAPKLPHNIATPVYVLDETALKKNMTVAARIKKEAGCKILLATKAFSLPAAFPLMRETLDGSTASGEYEARMGAEEFGKEVHVYSPAFIPGEVERLTKIAKHIYFNSAEQIHRYLPVVKKAGGVKIGLRINPGYSQATLGGPLYDPCAPYSRFGATPDTLDDVPWDEVSNSSHPCIVRSKALGLGGAHRTRCKKLCAVYSQGGRSKLRWRALRQQAWL